jgi:hypothetical protein
MIDEAHAMPAESLEEIRLLSNLESKATKLLQIALFAQPELDERLAANDMRQLRERITQHFNLDAAQTTEVGNYIEFRLRAAGYHGPNPFTDSGRQTDRRNFRRPVPTHQHPRRQGAACRLLKRQPPSRQRRDTNRRPGRPLLPLQQNSGACHSVDRPVGTPGLSLQPLRARPRRCYLWRLPQP